MASQYDTQFEAFLFKSIDNKIQSSYTLFLMTYCQLSLDEIPDCFKDMHAFLSSDLPNLKDMISKPFDQRDEDTEKYVTMRDNCLLMGKELLLYQFRIEFLNATRGFLTNKSLSETLDVPHYHASDIINACNRYIDSAPDGKIRRFIQNLITCIPIKMTKEKYYDYYRSGLASAISGMPDFNISSAAIALENRCIPMANPFYGRMFPQLREELDDIALKITSETEESATRLETLSEKISRIWSYLELYHEESLYMLILLFYSSDIDYLWSDNLVYKDLFYAVIENNDDISREAVYPRVIQSADDILEGLVGIGNELTTKIKKKLNAKSTPNLQSDELLAIYTTITNVFLENLFQCAEATDFPMEDSPLDKKESEAVIYFSADHIAEVLSSLKPEEQKLFRQISLGIIPCPFTRNEIFSYLTYFLDGASEKQLKQFICNINELFHSIEHNHEHHHHHEHGEDCDCKPLP